MLFRFNMSNWIRINKAADFALTGTAAAAVKSACWSSSRREVALVWTINHRATEQTRDCVIASEMSTKTESSILKLNECLLQKRRSRRRKLSSPFESGDVVLRRPGISLGSQRSVCCTRSDSCSVRSSPTWRVTVAPLHGAAATRAPAAARARARAGSRACAPAAGDVATCDGRHNGNRWCFARRRCYALAASEDDRTCQNARML